MRLSLASVSLTAAALASWLVVVDARAQRQSELRFVPQPGVAHGGYSRGVAWGDADGDGDPDLFVANGNRQRDLFYRNDGGRLVLQDASPLRGELTSSEAAAWIDFDDDGDLDLLVANTDSQPSALYRNDGSLSFPAIPAHALASEVSSTIGSCWADFTGDGVLDAILVRRNGQRHALFVGEGRGTYRRASMPTLTDAPAHGRACVAADLDGDGWMDLALAHAQEANVLLRNDSGSLRRVDGPFSAGMRYSYGLSAADYDEDGDLDLFVANIDGPNELYRNDGGFRFAAVTTGAMVSDSGGATKGHAWGDLDSDGHLDLYAANGTPRPAMHNWLYRGLGAGEYVRGAAGAATTDADTSAGTALADVDGDGRLDIFVANWGGGHDEDNVLYRNETTGAGRWIAFDLRAPSPNRYAIGAVVRVRTQANGTARWQTRWLLSSTGYGSQSDARIHFGLGASERVEEVEVRWPNGARDRHGPVAAGNSWLLSPGTAPRRSPPGSAH